MGEQHRPVLLDEVLDALQVKQDGLYVDGTFGRGGHAAAVLERLGTQGRLLAFDKDPYALNYAADRFGNEPRLIMRGGSFGNLQSVVTELGSARPADPSRPYPGNERRELQAQSEQAPLTSCQRKHAGG